MTAIHLQPRAPPCAQAATRHRTALDDLSDAAQSVVATLRAWRQRLRERDQLARLDDPTVRDIGPPPGDASPRQALGRGGILARTAASRTRTGYRRLSALPHLLGRGPRLEEKPDDSCRSPSLCRSRAELHRAAARAA